jgi:hypothetical protein
MINALELAIFRACVLTLGVCLPIRSLNYNRGRCAQIYFLCMWRGFQRGHLGGHDDGFDHWSRVLDVWARPAKPCVLGAIQTGHDQSNLFH